MIPYGRQEITEADIEAVNAVLRSDWLTQGPAVPLFEQVVASHCGAAHAVAVNSATSALHLACLALGVGRGDRVWTSPITFVASANCALYCGADVDFVDIDRRTSNLSVDQLEKKLKCARESNTLPKVVIPVHFAGEPCDMGAIAELSREYGFRVIEDASHAIGACYKEAPIGSCRHSDITVFSFHPVKIITTGEGGMALTNDRHLADRMSMLRSHGITRNPEAMTHAADGPWYYQQLELGYNYRMTDIQAALGISQFERLESYIDRRHALAENYDQLLSGMPLRILKRDQTGRSALHLYVVVLDLERGAKSRQEVFSALRASGVGVNVHYIPVHTQPYFQRKGFTNDMFVEAERYYAAALSLPIYPAMSDEDQISVTTALMQALH